MTAPGPGIRQRQATRISPPYHQPPSRPDPHTSQPPGLLTLGIIAGKCASSGTTGLAALACTEAALVAVAGSFGVRRSAVRLVAGASSRTKIVDIDGGDPRIFAALLAAPGRLRPSNMPRPSGRQA